MKILSIAQFVLPIMSLAILTVVFVKLSVKEDKKHQERIREERKTAQEAFDALMRERLQKFKNP